MNNGQMNYVMGGNSIAMSGTETISELAKKEAVKAFNQANKKAEDAYRQNIEQQIAKSNENKKRAEDLEIMPIGSYILFKLYTENPYEQILQTDSGLILPSFDGKELTRETGQLEKQQKAIEIGHVIEVGPDVVNIKPGDDIMLRAGMLLPVPFLRQGFWVTGQNNVLVVINKGLTDRFNDYKEKKIIMIVEEKVFFKPGDTVILKQEIPNRPKMVVVCKVSSYLRDPKSNYFKGIKCRWFNNNMELQEAVFNTKDLILVSVAEENN